MKADEIYVDFNAWWKKIGQRSFMEWLHNSLKENKDLVLPQQILPFTKHRAILSTRNIRDKVSNIECKQYDMGEKINEIINVVNDMKKEKENVKNA